MDKKLFRMICACAMLVTVLASAASAYPTKSNLSGRYECVHKSGDLGMGFKIFSDNTYRHDAEGQEGEYRYNRDIGRVNFTTGIIDNLFLKLSRDDGEWKYRLRNKNDGSLWGPCERTSG
jgi:hypothetical protein